jgi:hypothetical protein
MSAFSTQCIEKVNYTHDSMIDLLISNPEISQGEIADHYGYTPGWVSRVIRSDAFRERLAVRKHEIVDPKILESVELQFEVLVKRSLEVLAEKMKPEAAPSADLALKVADMGARALGYGATQAGVNITQQFVVAMPPKATDTKDWLEGRSTVVPG